VAGVDKVEKVTGPAPSGMTCKNSGFQYAKLRERTCGFAKGVDAVNTPQ
jgi:hypothetical protein